jgi:hypothetical protein
MKNKPLKRLRWQGRETVPVVSQLLETTDQIELELAPGYNHALFRKLHPEAPRATLEQVDRTGDAELLNTVSEITGLEDLVLLVEVLQDEEASVHIVSPPAIVIQVQDYPPAAA